MNGLAQYLFEEQTDRAANRRKTVQELRDIALRHALHHIRQHRTQQLREDIARRLQK